MRKKIICWVLASLMVVPLLYACKKTPHSQTEVSAKPGNYAEQESGTDGEKVEVSSKKFRIIYGDDASTELKSLGAFGLYQLIDEKTDHLLEMESDYENPPQKYEILVGDTNRDGNIDTSGSTYLDFGWTFDGEKVRIWGGSAEAIGAAVKRFVSKYYDAGKKALMVSTGTEVVCKYSYQYSEISILGTPVKDYRIASAKDAQTEANLVYKGFGKLCGVKLPIETFESEAKIPNDRYIKVGFGALENLQMKYVVDDGGLRFIGNGESGVFNQLKNAIGGFFDGMFETSNQKLQKDLTKGIEKTYDVSLANMEVVSDFFERELDAKFETAKEAILNSESQWTLGAGGTVYYVSPNGNDGNNGTSESTPWKTITKVNSVTMKPGSVVLFERGGVWNQAGTLMTQNGVTYSAYGTGAKPMLSNYLAANDPGDWTEVVKNVWVYSGPYSSPAVPDYPNDPSIPGSYLTSLHKEWQVPYQNDDVSSLVLTKDGVEGWGIKTLKYNDKNIMVPMRECATGFDGVTVTCEAVSFAGGRDLYANLQYYNDPNESRFYFYYDGGNPAECFDDIKLVMKGRLINGDGTNVTIDNLNLSYAGIGATSTSHANNYTIRNCVTGWCGGAIQEYDFLDRNFPTRYGGPFGNWGDCDGFYILNNYIYQTYDGAISSQLSRSESNTFCTMYNVTLSGNVADKCNMVFEFWLDLTPEQGNNEKFKFKDWLVEGNMIRGTGYGFGRSGVERKSVAMCGGNGMPQPLCENINLTGNTIWHTYDYVLQGLSWNMKTMYRFYGNTILHEYNKPFVWIARDFKHLAEWDLKEYLYEPDTIDQLVENNILGSNRFCFVYKK